MIKNFPTLLLLCLAAVASALNSCVTTSGAIGANAIKVPYATPDRYKTYAWYQPAPAEKPANATDERAKNVSHTREFELEKENGYYQMSGERDWGTNAQLNGFPYPVINPKQHPSKNIDTTGEQIQSGLYDGKGNKSGDGAPVRSKVNQEKAARKKPAANDQPNNLNQNSQKK